MDIYAFKTVKTVGFQINRNLLVTFVMLIMSHCFCHHISLNVQVIQKCTLANALSLWEVLSVEQARQLTLIDQVWNVYLVCHTVAISIAVNVATSMSLSCKPSNF